MINFAHIAPTAYLSLVRDYPVHLLLAHLVEEDAAYRDFYIKLKETNPNVFYHLDNSAFEMYKRGQPMYDSSKLLTMAKLVGADSIVMSDYPKEHAHKTIAAAVELVPAFKDAGFKTFFCPQSELGQRDQLLDTFEWALDNSDIDYIGVSILACPIGLGIAEVRHGEQKFDPAYRMQRFLSRHHVFHQLDRAGLLSESNAQKRFHCLGMTDGPDEIDLLRPWHGNIFSWDSSSAIWHAINGIEYDASPTGLRHGKLDLEVDFSMPAPTGQELILQMQRIYFNMKSIDEMCQ